MFDSPSIEDDFVGEAPAKEDALIDEARLRAPALVQFKPGGFWPV